MRRADRLFRLVTLLQRKSGPITGKAIGEELEVSVRTIYRDIADLSASGVPIQGEASVGYQMDSDFSMPPLMLTDEEVEAAVFGLAVAQEWGDDQLAKAAVSLRDKINASLPDRLREVLAQTRIIAPYDGRGPTIGIDQSIIRRCIRLRSVVELDYQDKNADITHRCIWPLGLVFFGSIWMLAGWCEAREDYRFFRLDRITQMEVLNRRFPLREDRRFEDMINKRWFGKQD